jgi:nitrite reductase (cytochrome c-552)
LQGLFILLVAAATYGVTALLMNVRQRKEEAEKPYLLLANLTEDTVNPAEWGRIFPRQYDGYKRTVDVERTRYGGSEAVNKLKQDPRLLRLFAGYGFAIAYREERGHHYMLSDQDEIERPKAGGACLHCHSSVLPAYRKLGNGDVLKGFVEHCSKPWAEARKEVTHPVTCLDCHDPKTAQIRVTRPGFLNGIAALAEGDASVPHLRSIERWREANKKKPQKERVPYNPNRDATRQELRSFVCAQCHVEYFFQGEKKLLVYPWKRGLKAEQIEKFYDEDEKGFSDWIHAETKAAVLKAQHPEFELWSQGIHARAGVACADCHMPYIREGAMKISDHHVRSPLLQVHRACLTCHRESEKEMLSRAELIQTDTHNALIAAEDALLALMDSIKNARGISEEHLKKAREMHRKAQWRVDFVAAENSLGFHAPREAMRLLGEARDLARQGQLWALGHNPGPPTK